MSNLGQRYIVQKGDTLSKIAKKFLGHYAKWSEIHRYNNQPQVVAKTHTRITDPNKILIGQIIYIPPKSEKKQIPKNEITRLLEVIYVLESAAISDGYILKQRITAFRKIFYDDSKPEKEYAGTTVGGGAWNILIPGAAKTPLPPSWLLCQDERNYLKRNQEISIGGKKVDIGHLFAGADAANYPNEISILWGLAVHLRSNQEAVTFIGDLGSVVVEYIHKSNLSLKALKEILDKKQSSSLMAVYNDYIKAADMAGNADSYALQFLPAMKIHESMEKYYTSRYQQRYLIFSNKVDITRRADLQQEVFNAALAYAAGSGRKTDVLEIKRPHSPEEIMVEAIMDRPTLQEVYWAVSGWVVDIFVSKIKGVSF